MIFWTGVVSHKSLPLPLRPFAVVIVLFCPSSCDAERAISVLDRTVIALRARMSWGNMIMHLIGAEDLNPVGYPYDEVASTMGARMRQHTKPKAKRKASVRNHGRARVLLSDVSDFGVSSVSSASSLSSISDSGSGGSGGTSDGGDSDSGSCSDSDSGGSSDSASAKD